MSKKEKKETKKAKKAKKEKPSPEAQVAAAKANGTLDIDHVRDLKKYVRGGYDLQKLRISIGNRIVGNFKIKLGQEPGKPEQGISAEGKKILAVLRRDYKRMADAHKSFPKASEFQASTVISTYAELCLIRSYDNLLREEEHNFDVHVKECLSHFKIWSHLKDIPGVGPKMGGVLIAEINIHKANTVSALWKWSGLDVAHDGRGRSKRKEHLVPRDYINKDGKPDVKQSITYNPFLKTKLMGVLADNFMRQNAEYKAIYDNMRHRYDHHAKYGEQNDVSKANAAKLKEEGKYASSPGHRHWMAKRYMVKIFLQNLYMTWREMENLPVRPPYNEEKLGRKHSA